MFWSAASVIAGAVPWAPGLGSAAGEADRMRHTQGDLDAVAAIGTIGARGP